MIFLIALALSPLVQTGLSYWVSCGTLLSLMIVYAARWNIAIALRRPAAAVVLLIFAAMYLSVLTSSSNDAVHDLLLVTRQGLIFALFCLIMLGSDAEIKVSGRSVITALTIITGSLLLLTAIQSVTLPRIYIGVPKAFFVQNENTLPTLLDMIFAKIRPMGTFGEPSYLGFYCSSLIFILLGSVEIGRYRKISILLIGGNLLIGLLSQSLAFILASSLIIASYMFCSKVFRNWVSTRTHIPLGIGFGAMLLFVALMALGKFEGVKLVDRVGMIFSGNDYSTNIRILYPLKILCSYIFSYPFGSAASETLYNISEVSSRTIGMPIGSIDNALIVTMFLYGFPGVLMLIALAVSTRSRLMLAYLLMCANFNGALLSVDKLAIVGLAIMLHSHFMQLARTRGPASAPAGLRTVRGSPNGASPLPRPPIPLAHRD